MNPGRNAHCLGGGTPLLLIERALIRYFLSVDLGKRVGQFGFQPLTKRNRFVLLAGRCILSLVGTGLSRFLLRLFALGSIKTMGIVLLGIPLYFIAQRGRAES